MKILRRKTSSAGVGPTPADHTHLTSAHAEAVPMSPEPEDRHSAQTKPNDVAAPPPIEGYAQPQFGCAGTSIEFFISTTGQSFNIKIVHMKYGNDLAYDRILEQEDRVGLLRLKPPNFFRDGCGWTNPDHCFVVREEHKSGMYAALCETADGQSYFIPFIITPKPGLPTNNIAVIANTNTWAAYNTVDEYSSNGTGTSQYSDSNQTGWNNPIISVQQPNNYVSIFDILPPVTFNSNPRHLASTELRLLSWLDDEGYKYDLWTDFDLDHGNVMYYGSLVLNTHPEYWTFNEIQQVHDKFFLTEGNLIILCGNAVFERVEYATDDGSRIKFRGGFVEKRGRYYWRKQSSPTGPVTIPWGLGSERKMLGVSYIIPPPNVTFVTPNFRYKVVVGDGGAEKGGWIFAGTGLKAGDTFGEYGCNGRACGQEVDSSRPNPSDQTPAPPELQVLARADVVDSWALGEMTYYEKNAGGFVFATGSLSFTSSIPFDTHIKRILKNIFDRLPGST